MKNFLLIQNESPIKDYIELYLKAYPDVSMYTAESISSALFEISTEIIFDSIFIGNSIVVDGDAKMLTERIKEYIGTNPGCKVIGSNKGLSTQDWVHYVPSMAPPIKIFEAVRYGLVLSEEGIEFEYAAVPMFCFNYFTEAPCDIYLKIGSKADEATYIKRFHEKAIIENSDIAKYLEKGMKDVYVPSNKLQELSDLITSKIKTKVKSENPEADQLEVVSDALDYASYVLNSLGINTKSKEIVQQVITNIITSASKMEKKKASQFQKILNGKEDFYHKHVSLTAVLATSILEELNWDNNEEVRTTLTYAAFFHNFIINDEKDIVCVDEASLDKIEPFDRLQKIRDHAKSSCDFIKDIQGVPYETQKLIMEHHGSHMGSGFPETRKNSNQLSSLFMIANEFALNFLLHYEKNNDSNIQAILKKALEIHGKANMKILEALQNCITGHMT